MATARDAPGAVDGGGCSSSSNSVRSSVSSASPEAVEAVAAEWMLEFACSCLCRHFAEQSGAEFWRWRDVAQALINGLSQIPPHQKKTVYLCQLLIRIAQGKSLGLQFENDQRISPLESALSFWTFLEREEIKLEKLHEDIRRLIQIQIVAVHMENRYFKEAAEVLERLFTDSESDKPLRVKLATIIKTKDPYVPLLQSFSYSLLISKIKSYIELFMKENETNFLKQEAIKHVVSKGLGVTALQNKPVEVNENGKSDLETKQRASPDTSERYDERLVQKKPMEIIPNEKIEVQNASYLQLKCLGNTLPKEVVTVPKLTEFKKHLHSGLRHMVTPGDVCAGQKAELSDPCGSLPAQQILYFSSRLVKEKQYITSQSSGHIKKPIARKHSGQKPKESRVLQSLNNMQNVETNEVSSACSRRRQRWTQNEDMELKVGVREFGVGNWAKILAHGNFNNRTSVMLKDRWRTLSKIKQS